MKVIIRADATPAVGSGHVVRCRTLAMALRARGAEVTLLSALPVDMPRKIFEEAGFQLRPINRPSPCSLEKDQDRDAHACLAALPADMHADWLIVDHYKLDARWERQLRHKARRMLVVDDLFDRPHAANTLLNQNVLDEAKARADYANLLSDGCDLLAGPRWAMLRPEYRQMTARARTEVKRVLIFFGGVDAGNLTGRALQALSRRDLQHLECDVVVGLGNANLASIQEQALARGRTAVHTQLPQLAGLMAAADLAIGAAGATTWERLCSGLPAVTISIADNQTAIADAVANTGAQLFAGLAGEITADILANKVEQLISDTSRIAHMSARGPALVDGFGAERVAEHMVPTPLKQLTLRAARAEDMAVMFGWVNDPVQRALSHDPTAVSWETHQEWYAKALKDPCRHLFVLEARGLPVGQIRFDDNGAGVMQLTYSLDPVVRDRKWAVHLLNLGLKACSGLSACEIRADVNKTNLPSLRAIQRVGFAIESDAGDTFERFSLKLHGGSASGRSAALSSDLCHRRSA
ncbi:MAG: UDP-2,4-diacetamido-2,4,6-trideoxy-beta-L-altropyranose hydrolase [Hyphomicrobiales bacterium]|nr:UDP-2,4-diacetamido-2,4,6-trideoxy-beta-L-altropyranose hydrolase [Hyphomicrobiales bacterium]